MDPSDFMMNYCEVNAPNYEAVHARQVQRAFDKNCPIVTTISNGNGFAVRKTKARVDLVGSLHPIAKYFLECDRNNDSN